eukprot:TRINITY_DN27869_c0_g1_i1.p1 TRINITY_DN27869_c0_g1~~TRINITY_DN27869_c0_g1_i1.p1  ORF type:complete len:292 (+),score=58.89 TRINITY_DN27869_c0_g1_i1:63-938(+)
MCIRDSYDAIGMQYYYLGDIEKANYFHKRMSTGKIESLDSNCRMLALSIFKNRFLKHNDDNGLKKDEVLKKNLGTGEAMTSDEEDFPLSFGNMPNERVIEPLDESIVNGTDNLLLSNYNMGSLGRSPKRSERPPPYVRKYQKKSLSPSLKIFGEKNVDHFHSHVSYVTNLNSGRESHIGSYNHQSYDGSIGAAGRLPHIAKEIPAVGKFVLKYSTPIHLHHLSQIREIENFFVRKESLKTNDDGEVVVKSQLAANVQKKLIGALEKIKIEFERKIHGLESQARGSIVLRYD